MNEIDLLSFFYEFLKISGQPHDQVFVDLDETTLSALQDSMDKNLTMQRLEELADICIANEWIERTTADPNYNFLSLTEAGLQVALAHDYGTEI